MKYIFIDTNQYRHLFSKNEGFSDEIKNLLDKLINQDHIKLLLPQQVKEEVERNRFESWYYEEIKDNNSKIKKIEKNIKELEESTILTTTEVQKIKKRLNLELASLKKEATVIKKRFRELKSKANQKLKKLFGEAELIMETDQIVYNARLRLDKGNPPKDNKLGDALIWESLLSFLCSAPIKSSLIFVARDGNAWGKEGFNPWLEKELKEKTKVSISFTKALADISGLTREEQEGLRKVEQTELKNNAVSSFINSGSFVTAGENCWALLNYKEILTEEDYIKIISASISNYEIYQSYFTGIPLNNLCSGDGGFVLTCLENIPKELWEKFVALNQIKAIRRCDAQLNV